MEQRNPKSRTGSIRSIKLTYLDYRNWFRIGIPLYRGLAMGRFRPHILLAYIGSRIKAGYRNNSIVSYLDMIANQAAFP